MRFRHFYIHSIFFIVTILCIHPQHVSCSTLDKDQFSGYTLQDSIEIYRLSGANDLALKKIDAFSPPGNSSATLLLIILEKAEIFRLKKKYDASKIFLDSAKNLLINLPEENALKARQLLFQGRWLKSVNSSQNSQLSDSILSCYSAAYKLVDTPETSLWTKAEISLEIGLFYFQKLSDMRIAGLWYQRLVDSMSQTQNVTDYRRGYYLFSASSFYIENGDYERSALLARIGAYIMKNGQFPDKGMYMKCLQLQSNSEYYKEKYPEAIKIYRDIIEFVSSNYAVNNPELIVHNVNIAQPLILTGKYDEAVNYCRKAEALINSTNQYENYLPWIYNNLAEANEGLGFQNEAIRYFEELMKLRMKKYGLHGQEVHEGLRYFGEYYERQGNFLSALNYYQKSMSAIFDHFEPAGICDNPDFSTYTNTETLFNVLFDKAGTLMKYWNQTKNDTTLYCANELYRVIYTRLDELINSDFLENSSMQIYHRFADGLDKSIACSVALYEMNKDEKFLEQAWQYMEKNKYFLLHKALVNANTFGSDNDRKVARQIDEINMKLQRVVNQDTVFILSNKLLDYLNEKGRAQHSENETAINISGDSTVLTLDNIRTLVADKSEFLVEFHWSEECAYIFLMYQGRANVLKIENTQKLQEAIQDYAGTISQYSADNKDFVTFTKAAYTLYRELFKPIEDRLLQDKNGELAARMIIIPDGPLATLPFEAFVMSPDTTSHSYWELDYLCRKYIVNYAYSLSILQKNLEKRQEVDRPGLLALSYSSQLDKNADVELKRFENELPYSAEEILRIKRIMTAKCFLGNDATETQFKALAQQYSIIHLALHGKADTSDMFNSRLIFKRDSTENEDGELRAFELYDMGLSKLQLVVLSACETGLGEVHEGEGIFSIARGFAYAGCPSLVMSLWKVNDKTTADLVEFFYKNLSQGQQKDEALRNAKLSFLKSADDLSAHPANWAAFIALGNNSPVQLPKADFPWQIIAFVLALASAGYFVWWKYLRKK